MLFLNVALQQSMALWAHVGEEHYPYAVGRKVEASEPPPPACWVSQMISALLVLGKVIMSEMSLDRPCWAVVMLGMGSCWQVSHPGALSEQLMVLPWWHHCLLCLWAQLVGLVCQKEESLELCNLAPVFSLCKRELDLCPIFAAVPMSASW